MAVIWLTSSTSTLPGQLSSRQVRLHISLPIDNFHPAVELDKIDIAGIGSGPPVAERSEDELDPDEESDIVLDFGSTEGKFLDSLKGTEFSLKQVAKRTRQHNSSSMNKGKKVWVAEVLGRKQQSIM